MAKVELEGHLREIQVPGGIGVLSLNTEALSGLAEFHLDSSLSGPHKDLDFGHVRIIIEQIKDVDPDKSPDIVASRVIERHRGTLDILEATDGCS